MNISYSIIISALFTGLITGIAIAIPMGPAGLESIRWTILKGFNKGFMVAVGSLFADAIDILLINYGLLDLIETNKLLEAFFWMLSGVIIFYIGYKSIKDSKNKDARSDSETAVTASTTSNVLKNKKMKSRPLFTGFIINFTNPMTHFFWLTLSTTVIRQWRYSGNIPYWIFSISMLLGMLLSLTAINFLASKGKKFAPPKLSGHTTILLSWAISTIGVGFFAYGIYKMFLIYI